MARKPRAAVAESAAIPDGSELNRALKVVYKPIDWLRPNARNARMHSDGQVQQIVASVLEFGWTNPVLCDETGDVIAGHGRLLAARQMRLADVPCLVLEGLSEAQKSALRIADNKLGLNAGWDEGLLKLELGDLSEAGFDLGLTGFSGDELSGLMFSGGGDGDPDALPPLPSDPVTRPGDLWVLGAHRVLCGDSTDPEHIKRLMGGKLADLCFTSPPYAQQRDYKSGGIADWDALMRGVFGVLPVKHEAQVLVNLGLVHREGEWTPYWDGWVEWMRSAGWRRFGWYVWDQGPGLPGDWNGRLAPAHEWVFHFNRVPGTVRKTKASKWAGEANHGKGLRGKDGKVSNYTAAGKAVQDHKIPDSVIRVLMPDSVLRVMRHKARGIETLHPAVFPVELATEILTAFSDPGHIVFEPFCGSGSQLISAQKNGRACYGMELAPEYCDVIIRRFQNFSGLQAIQESDGKTFAEIEAERVLARAEQVVTSA